MAQVPSPSDVKVELETDEDNDSDIDLTGFQMQYIDPGPKNLFQIFTERCLADDGDGVDVSCNKCQNTFLSFKKFLDHLHVKEPISHFKERQFNHQDSNTPILNSLNSPFIHTKDSPLQSQHSAKSSPVQHTTSAPTNTTNNITPATPPDNLSASTSSSISFSIFPNYGETSRQENNFNVELRSRKKAKSYIIRKSRGGDDSDSENDETYQPPAKRSKYVGENIPNRTMVPRSHRNFVPESYICKVPGCGKKFTYRKVYKNHMKMHNIEVNDEEPKPRPRRQKHRKERKYSGVDEKLPCSYENCNLTFRNKYALRIHKSEHFKQRMEENKMRRKERRKDYEKRKKKLMDKVMGDGKIRPTIRQNHRDKKWKCSVENCTEVFRFEGELTVHSLEVHAIDNRLDCTCGMKFKTQKGLKRHARTHKHNEKKIKKGGGSPNHVCVKCKKLYTSAHTLDVHIRRHHDNVRDYKCNECGRNFYNTSSLKEHKRTHTKEKPYACPECPWRFAHASNYRKHIQAVHRGLRPFLCPECGKSFSRSGGLSRHIMAHRELSERSDRKHLCNVCGKLFLSPSSLQQHQSVHTGEKPFKCPAPNCAAAYTQPPALRKHVEVHHSQLNLDVEKTIVDIRKQIINSTSNPNSGDSNL